jgi:hypothetical protein
VAATAFGVATRKSAVILTIKSDRQIASAADPQIRTDLSATFHHEVKLTTPTNIDTELIGWLREGYALSG